ncbi:hypothetical protein Hamer_G014989 [Homarus americanus]|uniref:Uncharacterized protein n=1 Tax=Homarus americanus TaxID=6706 RepID=A0A8J5MKK4_HOMAM|nr:hypothetical protein Hamer_G014989 [Homarus americanus]
MLVVLVTSSTVTLEDLTKTPVCTPTTQPTTARHPTKVSTLRARRILRRVVSPVGALGSTVVRYTGFMSTSVHSTLVPTFSRSREDAGTRLSTDEADIIVTQLAGHCWREVEG